MKKALIFTANEGHLSLATTIQDALKQNGWQPQTADYVSKVLKFYAPIYRYLPFLFKVPYKISEQETIQKAVKIYVERRLERNVKNIIKNFQPDLVISTYLLYNPAINKVLDYQKTPIPFINVVSNPWAIHPLELNYHASMNLVYDNRGIKIGLQNNVPIGKLKAIGWLVRPQFYQQNDLTSLRKKFGFKKNIFTLLICGGSEGTNMVLKIIPALLRTKQKLQVLAVCGTNKTLFRALLAFDKFIKRINKSRLRRWRDYSGLNLKIIPFTDAMPQLIGLADLVVGKAGPNLLFETISQKKPFFAICHISGQEDDNLSLIRKKGLGFVEENSLKAIRLLRRIVARPTILDRFHKSITKEYLANKKASQFLLQIVNSWL